MPQASKLTTEANPIPTFAKEDFWPTLNCVFNVISEKFSDGYIRMDLGYPSCIGEIRLSLWRLN